MPCGCVSRQRVSQLENPCPGLWSEFSSGSSCVCMENEDMVFFSRIVKTVFGVLLSLACDLSPKENSLQDDVAPRIAS